FSYIASFQLLLRSRPNGGYFPNQPQLVDNSPAHSPVLSWYPDTFERIHNHLIASLREVGIYPYSSG
ncbi:MAG TPA: hypothetical protein PK735_14975, partial [Flavobacteriales bacterium]|nr:hypothetical protein [Flavobacteriales bacterium]